VAIVPHADRKGIKKVKYYGTKCRVAQMKKNSPCQQPRKRRVPDPHVFRVPATPGEGTPILDDGFEAVAKERGVGQGLFCGKVPSPPNLKHTTDGKKDNDRC